MVIILNPFAAGGNALNKWKKIERQALQKGAQAELFVMNGKIPLNDFVTQKLAQGQQQFIAAGGDGTVNLILQALLNQNHANNLQHIKLGAIGLGSSNDFHKPFNKEAFLGAVPVKTDFTSAALQDIGVLSFEDDKGHPTKRYWINNASVGITAEANGFFNSPNSFLHFLKKHSTGWAIVYAALHTIFTYKNKRMDIRFGQEAGKTINVTNLGVIKNPHFSGSFSYDAPYEKNSGYFYVPLCHDLSLSQTLKTLWHLSQTEFSGLPNTIMFRVNQLDVQAEQPFVVEFDGETVVTRHAVFSIRKKLIQVCQK